MTWHGFVFKTCQFIVWDTGDENLSKHWLCHKASLILLVGAEEWERTEFIQHLRAGRNFRVLYLIYHKLLLEKTALTHAQNCVNICTPCVSTFTFPPFTNELKSAVKLVEKNVLTLPDSDHVCGTQVLSHILASKSTHFPADCRSHLKFLNHPFLLVWQIQRTGRLFYNLQLCTNVHLQEPDPYKSLPWSKNITKEVLMKIVRKNAN